MTRFVVRRLASMLVVLFAVSVLVFVIFNVLPNGDPAVRMAGKQPTETGIEAIRQEWGFDEPVYVQYVTTMKKLFTGDTISYFTQLNVVEEIWKGVPRTFSLAIGAALIWMAFGMGLGLFGAMRAGKVSDRLLTLLALVGISMPVFWIGALMNHYLGFKLGIFPNGGYVEFFDNPLSWLHHLILPWTALSILFIGVYSRVLRGNILDTVNEDFVRTARAKGLSERQVLVKHVLRNSLIPITTLWGLDFAVVIGGGAILTETVFSLQGVGQYAADAIGQLDQPPIMAVTMFGAFFVVFFNAIVDIVYATLDPRIRLGIGELDMSEAPLLSVTDLRVSFRTEEGVVKAVDGSSFEVRRGEVLAIVGESGCGKSVTAMSLMGLTRSPNAEITGTATLGDTELIGASDEELRKIRGNKMAMIFQDPMTSMNPVYRVGDQIVEQIQAHRDISKSDAMDVAVQMLEAVGIPGAAERVGSYPHEFSGGMRQRAMIAMGLSVEPELLIADEPTTALDVTIQAQILRLLKRINQERGLATILITHDLGVVADIADRVLVMYAGEIVESGTLDQIFYDPKHPYTWGLLGSVMRLDHPRSVRLAQIKGQPPSLLSPPEGCKFRPRCPHAFDRCTQHPALEGREGDSSHLDRCWLDPESKRAKRTMASGEIGLEAA